jgi:hypothetical protein
MRDLPVPRTDQRDQGSLSPQQAEAVLIPGGVNKRIARMGTGGGVIELSGCLGPCLRLRNAR